MDAVAYEFQIRQKSIFDAEFAPGSASNARAGWHGAIRPLHRELIFRFADRWVPRGARVLDVGCGDGEILRLFGPDRIREGVGIDLSSGAVRRAREGCYGLARHLRFEEARFEDLGKSAGTFDAILFLDVFEHFPAADGALARARGLLAPGGRLLILTPNVRRLTNRIRRLAARLSGETGPLPLIPSHFREYTLAEIREMLAARGFAVRSVETGGLFDFKYYPAPLRTSPAVARLNWEIGRPMRELASNFMIVAVGAGSPRPRPEAEGSRKSANPDVGARSPRPVGPASPVPVVDRPSSVPVCVPVPVPGPAASSTSTSTSTSEVTSLVEACI